MGCRVRELEAADWPAVRAIYEEGIASGDATFETEAPEWEAWDVAHRALRLVAERDGGVVGGPRSRESPTAASIAAWQR